MQDRDLLPPAEPDRLALCANLRSKLHYAPPDPTHVAHSTTSLTGVYWCAQTMAHAGPDDSLCDPEYCLAGRECHKSILAAD